MGLHRHGSTMEGALTPICNGCGVSLCWDIEANEALGDADFWLQWQCETCNGGNRMSLEMWRKSRPKMIFFFGAESPFSNWHMADFVVKDTAFCCNEQFLMYAKAKLFSDHATAAEILAANDPRTHKALGRKVRGFDEDVWISKRERYMYAGCLAKFSQNSHLADDLFATVGSELVEASPYDTIWGVGLAASSPRILDKSTWRGLNLLGQCLVRVRHQLLVESYGISL